MRRKLVLKKGRWSSQGLRILKERYLERDLRGRLAETPEEMVWRVAKEIAGAEKKYHASDKEIESLAKEFYQVMISRLFLPNSPTLMNAGRKEKLQYAGCYVLPVEDSIKGIFDAVEAAAIIHQSGGGTGFSFSRLRPQGARVRKSGGVASGPVSFMRVFDAATEQVKQGGRRRGANMGVLRVDHPDIERFITCKLDGGVTNFNISVAVTDEFMKALEKGKDYSLLAQPGWPKPNGSRYRGGEKIARKSARKIFEKIVDSAWRSGDPGIIWIDQINQGPANPVPSMGPVEATNPCLTGETRITTDQGLLTIKEIVEKKLQVSLLTDNRAVNGKGYSYRPVAKFWNNGKKEIWELVTKLGFRLEATPDHKIFTQRGWVPLSELRAGEDKVIFQLNGGRFNSNSRLPIKVARKVKGKNGRQYQFNLPDKWSFELGLVLGWLIGDGWLREDEKNARVGFALSEKKALETLASIINDWYGKEIRPVKRENNVWHLSYHSKFFVKFFRDLGVLPVKAAEKRVPWSIFKAPEETVIGFLRGLFTADGTVSYCKKNSNKYIRLTSKSRELLREVQLLLSHFGILSRIYDRSRPPKEKFSYKNKKNQNKNYLCDGICYELNISRKSLGRFIDKIGFFDSKYSEVIARIKQGKFYSERPENEIVSVRNTRRKAVVYDIAVPGANCFFANGILVHNCGEQPLYPNESCNLGSINLSLMVKKRGRRPAIDWEKLEKVVRTSVRFLDNVIDVNPFPLEEIRKSVLTNRRIGLGVMGWADLLFQLGVPYDSRRAINLAQEVMRFVSETAWSESERIAQKKGPFPAFKRSIYKNGRPRRNATVTTIAPTGSISIIAGCSSGIEPIFALAFTHKAGDRVLHFVNPYLKKALKRYKQGDKILKKVKEVGHLGEIKEAPKKLRDVFKTAHEIDWRWHIRMQAAFQKYTDNAVSKTINLANEATREDVRDAYLMSYKKGCSGITVFRDGCKGEQVLTSGIKEKKTAAVPQFEVKPRPTIVQGSTYRIATPVGSAFITVNHNGETDQPLEVFVSVGKAGSDIAADAEAIGRLISLCLRVSSPISPKKVTDLIIDQLEGIGGGHSVGFGKDRVRSLADGIAKVLKKHISDNGGNGEIEVVSQQSTLQPAKKRKDLCPNCGNATLVFEEGCAKCMSCGYSKC